MNIYEKLLEVKKTNISLQRDTKAFNYKYATLDQIQKKLWPELEKQKLRDKIKTDFCENNKIVLIRIKYSDKIENKLSEILNFDINI